MEIRRSSRLFIVDEHGRLLLFLYQDEHQAPFWATAGGELKPGEDYVAAAARELYEETGLAVETGRLLKERDEIYAVARSVPARWLEKYYFIECPSDSEIFAAQWTDEEKSTIQRWKWWDLKELQAENPTTFKPEWLPDLLNAVLAEREQSLC